MANNKKLRFVINDGCNHLVVAGEDGKPGYVCGITGKSCIGETYTVILKDSDWVNLGLPGALGIKPRRKEDIVEEKMYHFNLERARLCPLYSMREHGLSDEESQIVSKLKSIRLNQNGK